MHDIAFVAGDLDSLPSRRNTLTVPKMKYLSRIALATMYLVSMATVDSTELRLTAFNVKIFGIAKMGKPGVPEILTDIIQRSDLLLMQEIRNKCREAIFDLYNMVLRDDYGLAISRRLGRTSSKEEYAFFYKYATLTLLDTYQYVDDDDDFERPPMAALFQPVGATSNFSIISIHVKPSDAVAELEALYDVYQAVKAEWLYCPDIFIMSDLNADCSYVSQSELESLKLYNETEFFWPIDSDVDTTTGSSDCAYDRIILPQPWADTAYVNNSAQVFRFDTEYSLNESMTADVSDHYPVEMLINVP